MKKLNSIILILVVLLFSAFCLFAQAPARKTGQKTISNLDKLPFTCNPQLESLRIITVDGLKDIFMCVAVDNPTSATSKIGTYQKVLFKPATNRFTGYIATVDAVTNQVTTNRDTAAVYNAGGTVHIYDMDLTTPMNITRCDGFPVVTKISATHWTTTKNEDADNDPTKNGPADFRWCFGGEDERYRVTYDKPAGSQAVDNDWIWIADPTDFESSRVNVMRFGGLGLCTTDGLTDCHRSFKSAAHWFASHYAGTLEIPNGDFWLNNTIARRGITLPGNMTLDGAGAGASDVTAGVGGVAYQRAPTRIKITGSNQSVFRIGELTEKVTFKNLELAAIGTGLTNTYGVEGMGSFLSSQGIVFDNVHFYNLDIGIYTHLIPVEGTDDELSWQFDYIHVIGGSRFTYNRQAALYSDSQNSDYVFDGVHIIQPARELYPAHGIILNRAALVSINQLLGGGTGLKHPETGYDYRGGWLIQMSGSGGHVSILNSQCEMAFGCLRVYGAGDYSYPINLLHNIFGEAVTIESARHITSTNNVYAATTWTAGSETRIASIHDRFCYDANQHGCSFSGKEPPTTRTFFSNATVLTQTGQLAEADTTPGTYNYSLPAVNARIGTPVDINGTVNLETGLLSPAHVLFADLTAAAATAKLGSMVYCPNCQKGSNPCTLRADANIQGTLAVREENSGDARWRCL